MSENNTNNDIVLAPLGGMRGKRYDTLKGCTVEAVIYLGDRHSTEYDHPTLTLKKVREYDDGTKSSWDLLEIRFQRNNVNITKPMRKPEAPASGFMCGTQGCWGRTYGGRVQGDLTWAEYLETGLSLIERARAKVRENDRLHNALCKVDDVLLTLIVGLRKIGVTVVLSNAKLWTKRQYSLV